MSKGGPALGRVSAVLIACAAMTAAARAEPGPPIWRAPVEAELGRLLAPAEVARVLGDRRVREALDELFDGWDGVADTLTVTRQGGELVVATTLRERRCLTRLSVGPELGRVEPICDEVVRQDGERSLRVGERVWRERVAPRAPRPPSPVVASAEAAQAHPSVVAPEPKGPVDNTVLRVRREAGEDGEVAQARASHEALKEAIRRPHWKDPMLPTSAVEAGDALKPLESPPPAVEARAETNLRNPFDEARMRTDLPVPAQLTLGRSGGVMPLLPDDTEACREEWQGTSQAAAPPTLDCFRRVAWNDRLADSTAYRILSTLQSFISLPLLDTLVAMEVRDAVSHTAHRLVWALSWLAWVEAHPERAAEALDHLNPEERRVLRRRLSDWWVATRLESLRPTITRLFERHFLGLYPEARDLDGLPRRAFVTDTWLWANNWLAVLDGRPEDAIREAYGRLSGGERRVIDAFVRDGTLAPRWTRAAAVLAGR